MKTSGVYNGLRIGCFLPSDLLQPASLGSGRDERVLLEETLNASGVLRSVPSAWSPSLVLLCRSSCGGTEITLNFVLTLLIKDH
ncbi:hypothetical protein EYF80_058565 [Liparis tanakae]|uniref:Uncharacterized protein n=1 Tax=Liparis tanakae TaxID=230148 RepID=A0A4Z2ESF0_9TELE|nr:hypothetical protein EYF80_058565 [Liparis tanakae]